MSSPSNKPRRSHAALWLLAALAALAVVPAGNAARAATLAKPAPVSSSGAPGNGNPSPGQSGNHAEQTARGIVQSVSPIAIVLKELDGTTVTVPVDTATAVLMNGKPAALTTVTPGSVAVARWKGTEPAQQLQVVGPTPLSGAGRAVVKSVSVHAVVVTEANGTVATLKTNHKTRVFVDGKQATLRSVKAGFAIDLTGGSTHGKPPAELHFLSSG